MPRKLLQLSKESTCLGAHIPKLQRLNVDEPECRALAVVSYSCTAINSASWFFLIQRLCLFSSICSLLISIIFLFGITVVAWKQFSPQEFLQKGEVVYGCIYCHT
jgi:hypothetical protein